jgi:Ca2+/Na+ antiporter
MGWIIWNAMRLAAILGLALFTLSFILFVWYMFEVGFAWVGIVVIVLAFLLLFFSVKNRKKSFDIRL